MTLRVRAANLGDLGPLLRIEEASFGNPWPHDAYVQELEREHGRLDVAEEGDVIVGFSCTWHARLGKGPSSEVESHLLRIAVDQTVRRRGAGRALLDALVGRARALASSHITLEVASQNRPAIALYGAAGFTEIARRVAYYRSPPDDAVIMRLQLSKPEGGPPGAT